jgi:hypothetical protein
LLTTFDFLCVNARDLFFVPFGQGQVLFLLETLAVLEEQSGLAELALVSRTQDWSTMYARNGEKACGY